MPQRLLLCIAVRYGGLILPLPLPLTLTKQAHVELAARLKKRDPGSAPNVLP